MKLTYGNKDLSWPHYIYRRHEPTSAGSIFFADRKDKNGFIIPLDGK